MFNQILTSMALATVSLFIVMYFLGQFHGWRLGIALSRRDVHMAAHHLRWFNFEDRCVWATRVLEGNPNYESTMFRISCLIHVMNGGTRKEWLSAMCPHVAPPVFAKALVAVYGKEPDSRGMRRG